MQTAEDYVKAGGSYLLGVALAALIDNFVKTTIIGKWETNAGWTSIGSSGGSGILNALVETSLFLVVSAFVGPRLSSSSQLLFTIGLFSYPSNAESFGSAFGTWAYGKM